jgi:glycerophosphoryl diester phosphodiesterase
VQIHVWTIDEEDEMRALLALGVDGIVTDYPARLAALLRAR